MGLPQLLISGCNLPVEIQKVFGDLSSDQGTVATGPVIDDNSNPLLPPDRFTDKLDRIFTYLRAQHPSTSLSNGNALA